MNPKNMKQYQNLLWLGVPAKKRDSVRGDDSAIYIDPGHVAAMRLTCSPKSLEETEVMPYRYFSGCEEVEHPIRLPRIPTDGGDTVGSAQFSVDYLRKIIDNITADTVRVTVEDDGPIFLEWTSGHDEWTAMIAPRIDIE